MNGNIQAGEPLPQAPSPEDLAQLEAAILIEPQVLTASIMTLTSQYADRSIEGVDGYWVSQELTIAVGEHDETELHTVRLGRSSEFVNSRAILRKDPQTGALSEWIKIFGIPSHTIITDGAGNELTSEDSRAHVRLVIDTIKQGLLHTVAETADTFDIKAHALRSLDADIAETESRLLRLKFEKEQIEREGLRPGMFNVAIRSSWDEEKDVDRQIEVNSPSDAIVVGIHEFKNANGRTDVQTRSVSVGVPGDGSRIWEFPKDAVMPLYQALTQHDFEPSAIRAVKLRLEKLNAGE